MTPSHHARREGDVAAAAAVEQNHFRRGRARVASQKRREEEEEPSRSAAVQSPSSWVHRRASLRVTIELRREREDKRDSGSSIEAGHRRCCRPSRRQGKPLPPLPRVESSIELCTTGGVALTNGLVSALEERVLHAIPPNEAIDTVEVSGSNLRKGDLLVIAGATLYAISNASDEFLVKNVDRVELMAMLGLFGGIISAIQINILERNELRSIHWSIGTELPFIGFAVAMFMFYSLVPVLLKYKNVAKKYCPPSVPSEYFQN
ncbi:hypothetical protein AHAS_Ahas13G0399800 [Arachis hypogaea]